MYETDKATIDQLAEIEYDMKKEPMIGDLISLNSLLAEYQNADLPGYIPGIHYLESKYAGLRKIRRDGNCFYRAFLFSYLENIYRLLEKGSVHGKNELDRLISVIKGSKTNLIELGFSEIAFECFYDVKLN